MRRRTNGQNDLKILNVGVATGYSSTLFNEFGTVTSVEYDRETAEFASTVTGTEVVCASVTALPFKDAEFDMVFAFDVIEHVEDDSLAVKELCRTCKKDGFVFITVPAFMFLWSNHDVVNHHFRRYTMKSLIKLLADLKTEVVKSTYFNFFLFFPIAAWRLIAGKGKGGSAGSDNRVFFGKGIFHSIINAFFYGIFLLERPLLRFLGFPKGVSILLILKKP